MKMKLFVTFACFCGLFSGSIAIGTVPLDSWTFDKVTSKFPVSIVKFDVAYPYGPKHDAYNKMAEAARNSPDVLIAEVGIKDYGDKENADLADRFKIDKEQYPVVKLFVQGKEPILFKETTDEGFTPDNLIQFIRSNSGKYIGLPGCLEAFDKLASQFKSTSENSKRKDILKDAESLLEKANSSEEKRAGEVYVKMMQRMLDKGTEFVEGEVKRINKLLTGKLSNEKKTEMGLRINILRAFQDEL